MHEELRCHQNAGGHATSCFRRTVQPCRSHYTVECIVRLVAVHPQLDVRMYGPSLRPAITVLLWPKRNRLIQSRTLFSFFVTLSPQLYNIARTLKMRITYSVF